MIYIWSDEAFFERVEVRATGMGITVREVLRRAGLSEDTRSKNPKQSRKIDTILKIARACEMPPEEAFALQALKIEAVKPGSEQLKRLALVEHVAAQLYTSLAQRPGLEGVAAEEIQRLLKSLADAAADVNQNQAEGVSRPSADTPNPRRRTRPSQSTSQ